MRPFYRRKEEKYFGRNHLSANNRKSKERKKIRKKKKKKPKHTEKLKKTHNTICQLITNKQIKFTRHQIKIPLEGDTTLLKQKMKWRNKGGGGEHEAMDGDERLFIRVLFFFCFVLFPFAHESLYKKYSAPLRGSCSFAPGIRYEN